MNQKIKRLNSHVEVLEKRLESLRLDVLSNNEKFAKRIDAMQVGFVKLIKSEILELSEVNDIYIKRLSEEIDEISTKIDNDKQP